MKNEPLTPSLGIKNEPRGRSQGLKNGGALCMYMS